MRSGPVSSTENLAQNVYLGIWQPGAPWDMSRLTNIESKVGKKFGILMWYQGWGVANAPLDVSLLEAVSGHGALPVITWEPWDYRAGINQPAYSTANIAAGAFDSYIRSWAVGLKNYGKTVFLRFAHEMNYHAYPWSVGVNGNTSQSYVAAWRHIHGIFTEVGADNVIWVWSPGVKYEGTTPFAEVYPGDSYVDWLALDGYNGGTALPWGGWLTFEQVFAASYKELTQLSQKPIMIAETASVEQGGSKATWIADALLTQLPERFPRIRALVWFNENRVGEADWRIDSSQESLAAFAIAAANPYYSKFRPQNPPDLSVQVFLPIVVKD